MVKILLVEETQDRREAWASSLRARGMELEVLEGLPGDDHPGPPCVLVLGPGSGGGDLVASIAKVRDWAGALVCIVADGDVEQAAEAGRAGADVVLEASVAPARLHLATRCLAAELSHRELSEESRRVRDRYAELEALVYLISHDLKTPLVSVQGIATILLDGDADEERSREYVRRIQANAERIEDLVRDLLEFPRVGRLVGVREPVDMAEVVDRALDNLQHPIEEAEAEIEVQRDLPVVMGDGKRLQQALHNLLDNAVKYGGRPPRIEVGHRSAGDEEIFWVRDDGPGISRDDMDKAFHLFRRLDATKKRRDGMGIGLAVSRRIIEGHHGRMWVESEAPQGATFYFALPRRGHESLEGPSDLESGEGGAPAR